VTCTSIFGRKRNVRSAPAPTIIIDTVRYGANLVAMPRPPRRSRFELELSRTVDDLRTKVCLLNRELENRQGAVGRLELLLHERLERIDALNNKLAQVREQNRRLDQENEHLAEMIKFRATSPPAMRTHHRLLAVPHNAKTCI
jgi:hypothetical protein